MPQTPDSSGADSVAAEKLYTSEKGVALLNEHGVPISLSTFEKLDSPAINDGPPVDAWWGRRKLRKASTLLTWAHARLSSERRSSPHHWPTKPPPNLRASTERKAKRSNSKAER